ncbi:MAG: hypothetical protein RSE41_04540, partial [Clostridia bacterium]
MNRKRAKYIIIPFLGLTFGFFIMNGLAPEKKYSLSENRNLEIKPSIKEVENHTYTEKFEKYYSDQFVFRENLININRKSEAKLKKTEVGNYYLGEDNWILGKFSKPLSEKKLNEYSNVINKVGEISQSLGKDVYYTMTPHKTNMLKHLYPSYVDNKDGIDNNKNELKANIEPDLIRFIDLDEYFLEKFNEKQLEKMYFKTDHHWNGIGAFEGFKVIAKRMDLGITNKDLDNHFSKYKTKVVKNKEFIGSYNRNLDMLIDEKDYPTYVYLEDTKYEYFLNNGKKDKKVDENKVIAISRNKDSWDYGGAYIRGAQCNMLKIKNKNALVDKKVLIFRDSYQAPNTWLFADLFTEVLIVDPRN